MRGISSEHVPFFPECFAIASCVLKVVEKVRENNKLITEYDVNADDLIKWIQVTTVTLQERDFANTLVGVQQQMIEFNQYRTQEKPPRYE
jgi:spectrin beta